MPPDITQRNAWFIDREIAWFQRMLDARFRLHGGEPDVIDPLSDPDLAPPALPGEPIPVPIPYADVIRRFDFGAAERLVLMLAYLPHIRPDILDPFLIHNHSMQRRFTEFGGLIGAAHGGFLPTGETALFLVAGGDLVARLCYRKLFHNDHAFYTENILHLIARSTEEPALAAALCLSAEYIERLGSGAPYHPPFSAEFPAQLITTNLTRKDLVLDSATEADVEEIIAWAKHKNRLLKDWHLERCLKPGFRSLFYGPPGTGKTLTATLIGQEINQPVYRIDLSKVISKYIGETEKNLASLFDHAQHRDWILFFDEADSLFGQRTESRNSTDHAANQQISYLLQRIEDFPGVVILASNLRSHLDQAFSRRFQSMILFAMPKPKERLKLWDKYFKGQAFELDSDVDLKALADAYELSGGSILNVLRSAALKAATRTLPIVTAQDLLIRVRRELHKDGTPM